MRSRSIALANTIFALAGLAEFIAFEGRARAVEDFTTPRSLAMGEALRADASGSLGPLLNPAAMVFKRAYSLEAVYGFRVQDTGSNLLASIVDSVTSRVAAGLYYAYVHGSPHLSIGGTAADVTREGHETGLSLALPIGEKFSFGVTTKYMHITTTAALPTFDPKTGMPGTQTVTLDSTTSAAAADGFTMDVGAGLRLGESFNIGLVGYNLIPLRSREAPVGLGTGLAYKYLTVFTAALDLVVDFNKYKDRGTGNDLVTVRLGGGLEYLAGGKVALRAGAFYDQGRPGAFVSGGIAYVGTSFAIDLGYRQQAKGGVESTLIAGVRVFLE